MSTSTAEIANVRAQSLHFEEDALVVQLSDGRVVSVPLTWYPRLYHGTASERSKYRLIGNGLGIHWPDLEEDISVTGLLIGRPSEESQSSLSNWLATRNNT